ncbi:MAG: hypothetical protein MUO43_13040 [Desulfobacterales bacterium]|nr:hypothetical protein [Desulfobacterales bacterium]
MIKQKTPTPNEVYKEYVDNVNKNYTIKPLGARVPKEFKCFFKDDTYGGMLIPILEYPIFDHVRILTPKEGTDKDHIKTTLLLQPYSTNIKEFEPLIKICKENNLDCYVEPMSIHYVGCYSIWISKKEPHKQPKVTPKTEQRKDTRFVDLADL